MSTKVHLSATTGAEARKQHTARVRDELNERNAVIKAVDRLMEGLDAVNSEGGPDWRNRRENSMAILAYAEGRPIEMVWQVRDTVASTPSLEALLGTPGAVQALMLKASDIVGGPDKLRAMLPGAVISEAVDIEAVTVPKGG